jgi:hypothetical protein
MVSRMRRIGRDRWPPPQPIDPAARLAALTTAGCLIAGGIATIALAWNELTCTVLVDPGAARSAPPSLCDFVSAIGGVVAFLGAAAFAGGVGIAWALRGREVREGAHDGWRWALAITFVVGALILITRIPSETCGAGFTPSFGLCIDAEGGGRYDATSWVWAKMLGSVAALVIGFGVVPRLGLIAVTIPLTVVVWTAGIGWLLLDTIG